MRLQIFKYKITQLCKKPLFLSVIIFVPGLFSILLGGFFQETMEKGSIPVALVDLDQTEYSKLIVARMKEQDRIKIIEMGRTYAARSLERGDVDCVFIIKATFSEQLLAEKREEAVELWTSPLSMATAVVQEMMAGEITRISSNIKAANWVVDYFETNNNFTNNQTSELWNAAYEYSDNQWIPEPLMTIDYKDMNFTNRNGEETASKADLYFGFWMAFTMLTTFILTEPLLHERTVILLRMRTTYYSVRDYLLQSGLAYYVFLLVQTAVSVFFLERYFSLNLSKLYIELLVFLFFSLSLGIGLASFLSSLGMYYSTGLFLTFALNILGGSFFRMKAGNFPVIFVHIGESLPQHWLMNGASAGWQIILIVILSCLIWALSMWRLVRFYD